MISFRRAIKPRPALLVSYANGPADYVPASEAFAPGGYAVDFYPGDPPQYTRTMIPKGAGEQLLEALLSLYTSATR